MTGQNEDYWTDLSAELEIESAAPLFDIETIEGVEPLDEQFGAAVPLFVPHVLREALFGQDDRGEGRAGPPMQTYALLDAAKVPGLPELLATSGLDHACLYQGEAAADFGDTAPWIVRLEETNPFTRTLFTRGEMPWHL